MTILFDVMWCTYSYNINYVFWFFILFLHLLSMHGSIKHTGSVQMDSSTSCHICLHSYCSKCPLSDICACQFLSGQLRYDPKWMFFCYCISVLYISMFQFWLSYSIKSIISTVSILLIQRIMFSQIFSQECWRKDQNMISFGNYLESSPSTPARRLHEIKKVTLICSVVLFQKVRKSS
jgi:hypothetical protein